jgi:hypothetical protein
VDQVIHLFNAEGFDRATLIGEVGSGEPGVTVV